MDEDLIERLEAEAKVANAEPEELTVVSEGKIEEATQETEELRADLSEKEEKVEELQSEVEEKTEQVEELQDEVDHVVEIYAEELAEDSDYMEQDSFEEKFSVSELRKMYEKRFDSAPGPNPNSGDPGPNVQSPDGDGGDNGDTETAELSEAESTAADAFEDRAKKTGKGVWADIAEDIRSGE